MDFRLFLAKHKVVFRFLLDLLVPPNRCDHGGCQLIPDRICSVKFKDKVELEKLPLLSR